MGLFLMTAGVFGVMGSITGRLPSMLAGLFDPSDLVSSSGGGQSLTQYESTVAGVNPTAPGGVAAPAGGIISWLTNWIP